MATSELKVAGETTAPEAKPRGFGQLPCPACRSEAAVSVYLDDLTTFRCADCEETFDVREVRELIDKWSVVLRWLDTAPAAE